MNNVEQVRWLLNCNNLKEHWNLSYGITKNRNDSLTRISDRRNSDSFFNLHPESAETVLSLFMLGNMDKWNQVEILDIPPRLENEKSDWNKDFFNEITNNRNVFKDSKKESLWKDLFNEKINIHDINFQKSILLFEFQIMNNAFHPTENGTFKNLSFTDIDDKKMWSRFDAVLIIPDNKLFIFIEAKLSGYADDFSIEKNNKPPQILRNLESIYLLTNHEKSHFTGWDFFYLFISPNDLKGIDKYYSKLDNSGAIYEEMLEQMKKSSSINKYFQSFKNDIPKHIIKKNWNEIGKILTKNKQNFFEEYLSNLKKSELFTVEQISSIKNRFLLAGIDL